MDTIMLIDDDKMFGFLNKRVVEKLGEFSNVELYDSAPKALDAIRNNAPDYVLLDIMMPVMNGFQFLDELLKLPESYRKNIKVLMLTSSLLDEDYRRSLQYPNVVAFLTKPLTSDQLKRHLV